MEEITLKVPPEMSAALTRIAQRDDISVGQLIRSSIEKEFYRREKAKTAFMPDERLVAPLRALLADDFAYANGWVDLAARLHRKGYKVNEAGGGIAVFRLDGTKVCKGSDLGCSYSKLMKRFNAPFPNHAHRKLRDRVLIAPE